MDTLTRWAIAMGAGVLGTMLLLTANYALAAGAQADSARYAYSQLIPKYVSLDVTATLITFDHNELNTFADKASAAGLHQYIDCGGYQNPAHVCTDTVVITRGLFLTGTSTAVIRDGGALAVGEYRSDYTDVLKAAQSVTVDVGAGPQPVTDEGGRFTVSFLDRSVVSASYAPWQYGLAAAPPAALWLAVIALGILVAIGVSALIRPALPAAPVEFAGIEVFDELFD